MAYQQPGLNIFHFVITLVLSALSWKLLKNVCMHCACMYLNWGCCSYLYLLFLRILPCLQKIFSSNQHAVDQTLIIVYPSSFSLYRNLFLTESLSPTSSSRTDSSPRFNSFIFVPFMHHFSPYVRPLNLSFPPINLPTSNPSPSPCPPPLACFHLSINRKSLPYTSLPLFILSPELSKTRVSLEGRGYAPVFDEAIVALSWCVSENSKKFCGYITKSRWRS